jgi:hypothetical protein
MGKSLELMREAENTHEGLMLGSEAKLMAFEFWSK